MPVTPYHFGPNAFVGLLFRRWVDPAVIVLANIIVDVEVLAVNFAGETWPNYHRYWHLHTFLIGGILGGVFGATIYAIRPLRLLLERAMKTARLDYKPNLYKMVIAGILGVWLHVLFDSVYHADVQPFWPSRAIPLYRWISWGRHEQAQMWIRIVCGIFWLLAGAIYCYSAGFLRRKPKAAPASPAATGPPTDGPDAD